MEDNSVRFTKCFIILSLSLLMGSCPFGPNVNIGDYEYHLKEWNNQRLLDYKLSVSYSERISFKKYTLKKAVIYVKNGIAESSNPPEWLESGEISTILDFFSFIKKEEKN
jgi:hypothetical protein